MFPHIHNLHIGTACILVYIYIHLHIYRKSLRHGDQITAETRLAGKNAAGPCSLQGARRMQGIRGGADAEELAHAAEGKNVSFCSMPLLTLLAYDRTVHACQCHRAAGSSLHGIVP